MNRSALIITVIVILLIAAGVWTYDHFYNRPDPTLWDLIPENTSLIYEPTRGPGIFDDLEQTEIWNSLSELSGVRTFADRVALLDTLLDDVQLATLTGNGALLITVNPVSGTELDMLYLVDRRLAGSIPDELVNRIVEMEGASITERQFNTYTIYEAKNDEGKVFSYSYDDYYWWGSFTPFLAEDVIRQLSEPGKLSFQKRNPEPFFNTKINRDAGNVYFNYKHLGRLLASFLKPQSRELASELSASARSAFLDLDINDQLILLTGFSYYGKDDRVEALQGITPAKSDLPLYIPSSTAYFWTVFTDDHGEFGEQGSPGLFASTLGSEVATAVLEGDQVDIADRLLYYRTDQPEESERLLKKMAEEAVASLNDTLYVEVFGENSITELRFEPMIKVLAEKLGTDSDRIFYTLSDDLLVFSVSIQAIKQYIVDLETDNTWGRSIRKNDFLANTLQESTLGFYMDINRSWNYLMEMMHPSWSEYLEENAAVYRNFELLAVQLSYTDRKYFTNLTLSLDPDNSNVFARRKRLDADRVIDLPANVVTKPKLTRNHTGPERELMLQTADRQLHLVSPSSGPLWSDSLESEIVGNIYQVDYYRNGKLQYAFATDSAIHIMDRLGNEIEDFPVKLDYKADQFSVIDYDNSRRYRLLLADIRGNIFLYDQEGNNLEGWRPRETEGRLARAPFHIRVRGRDCIVVVQENGKVNLLNRRGEQYPGFPLDLGPDLQPDMHIAIGGSFGNTILTFITTDGLLTRYDLNGKRLNSQQLFRSSMNVVFQIVPEIQGKDFVIVSKDIAFFQVLDKNAKEIFRSNIISTRPFNYQYYDFGSNRKLYVVTDPEQEFSYLYDRSGTLINNSPIDSKFDISVLFSERNNEYKIYSAYENKINIYSF